VAISLKSSSSPVVTAITSASAASVSVPVKVRIFSRSTDHLFISRADSRPSTASTRINPASM
jgi:hypothetical protein